jgi:hypothetical protein
MTGLVLALIGGRSRARTVDGQTGLDGFTTFRMRLSTGLVLKKVTKVTVITKKKLHPYVTL